MKATRRAKPKPLSGLAIAGFSLIFLVQWFFNNLWSFGALILLFTSLEKIGISAGDISEGYRAVVGLALMYTLAAILSALMTWAAILCYRRVTRKWLFWALYLCLMAVFIKFTGWMFHGIDKM